MIDLQLNLLHKIWLQRMEELREKKKKVIMWNKITDTGKLKTSEIIAEMRKKFNVWVYDEENIDKEFPPPKTSTTRTFKPNVEADEENANKSSDDLGEEGLKNGITLRERLIMELQYFKETGKHLDNDNITLCAGSRHLDGGIPSVHWSRDFRKVYVDWYSADDRNGDVRSRSAVSFDTSNLETSVEEAIKTVKKAGYKVIKEL